MTSLYKFNNHFIFPHFQAVYTCRLVAMMTSLCSQFIFLHFKAVYADWLWHGDHMYYGFIFRLHVRLVVTMMT